MAQFDLLMTNSFSTPQLIFKHSTRCSISRFVLNAFIANYGYSPQDFGAWYLDLLVYRSISDRIAQRLDVVHESPQLIVIKNGKTLESASHENINNLLLSEFLN
jgi:bacillithiol system protein YtxJ